MRRLILVSLIFTACGPSEEAIQTNIAETEAARPTETAVPATETPEPTATLTSTPTVTPTSTPDLTATAIVEATQSTEALFSRIEQELERLGLSPDDGELGWHSEDAITVINDSDVDEGKSLGIADNQSYSDFVLHTTLVSNGEYGCGIILRWEKPEARELQYHFFITNDRKVNVVNIRNFGLEKYEYGGILQIMYLFGNEQRYYSTPIEYNPRYYTSAINTGEGSSNEIVLFANDFTLTVYVNGERLRDFNISSRREGFLGVHTYSSSSACTFEDTWVWDLSEQGEED